MGRLAYEDNAPVCPLKTIRLGGLKRHLLCPLLTFPLGEMREHHSMKQVRPGKAAPEATHAVTLGRGLRAME